MRLPLTHRPRHLRKPPKSSKAGRLALAAGVLCSLGIAAGFSGAATTVDNGGHRETAFLSVADRDGTAASRGARRQSAAKATTPKKAPAKPAKKAAPRKPAMPNPVAGLSQVQTNNANAIVQTGLKLKMPRRALVIAVATAIQESTLLNRASEVLRESYMYPHQGTGADHDSVGLFQQRPSAGWGSVRNLMKPAFAATQFYRALISVPGWQRMSLTAAAQAVQVSAYPDAYAQHERIATAVVNALLR